MGQGMAFNAEAGAATPHVWFLPSEPASAGVLRQQLRALLVALPPAQIDDVVLTASEVIANAVVHGAGPVTVWVWPRRHGLRVEVTDSGGGTPQLNDPIDDHVGGGRGLFIVDEIATRWGVIPSKRGPGKTLWFEIDSSPDETESPLGSRAYGW
jgi:anti-sigma regulatory factor (Ser/Thr protein kinase)